MNKGYRDIRFQTLELANHGCLIGGLEHGATGYEHIGTGLDKTTACVHIDASIDLDEGFRTGRLNETTQLAHLLDGMLNELLSAKTGVHGHKEHHIDIANDVNEHAHGCGGVEGDTGLHACLVYLVDDTVEVGTGFVVHIHHHGTQGLDLRDKLLGLHDHEVYVEGLLAQASYMLEHWEPKRDVGNKHAIHHIEMEPVGLTTIDHINIACQIGKVGSQQRRGNHRTHIYTTDNLIKQDEG